MARSKDSIGPGSIIQVETLFLALLTFVTAQKIVNIITSRCIANLRVNLLKLIPKQDLMCRPDSPSHFPISLPIKLISLDEY